MVTMLNRCSRHLEYLLRDFERITCFAVACPREHVGEREETSEQSRE